MVQEVLSMDHHGHNKNKNKHSKTASRRNNNNNIYPRGGASLKQYRDVIQISQASQLKVDRDNLLNSYDEYDPSNKGYVFSRNRPYYRKNEDVSSSSSSEVGTKNKPSSDVVARAGNPVVYRYFGRSRARSVRSDSVPFIVIGPCVDHWKLVGEILASRGFNCIAIERVKESKSDKKSPKDTKATSTSDTDENEGEALVRTILDVLKWQRAILVGCDEESVIGIEAALRLAPDRVVGLILCGDLSSFQNHIAKQIRNIETISNGDEDDSIDVASFLEYYVECPCQLVYGDVESSSSPGFEHLPSAPISKIILGGGLAPHRRLPEQFAWTLTRFLEEKVSVIPPLNEIIHPQSSIDGVSSHESTSRFRRNFPFTQIFAPGTLLVTGRLLASTIIYLSIARATVVQYRNIRDIQSCLNNLSRLQIVKNILNKLRKVQFNHLFALSLAQPGIRQPKIVKKENGDEESDRSEGADSDLSVFDSDVPDDKSTLQNDDEKEETKSGEDASPLLQKLLFFDQIIS